MDAVDQDDPDTNLDRPAGQSRRADRPERRRRLRELATPERREAARAAGRRLAAAVRRANANPRLVASTQALRARLPGDPRFGDTLSTGGPERAQLLARRLAELTGEQPGVLREAGLGALQVWEGASRAQGRGRGPQELAVLFTDLVSFSEWVLSAGDEAALELLRAVAEAIEPPVAAHGGRVVKRLGDGMMATFLTPEEGVAAVRDASDALARIDIDGYVPQMRAGLHVGYPRRIGGDYFGLDVNVAARLTEQAKPGELLLSGAAQQRLALADAKRRRRFKVKGVPADVEAYGLALR